MPVLGFNSGRYDLNLIKEHFIERITEPTGTTRVAKNSNKIMFMTNKNFRFLNIINYLGPGTSYDKWVKAYGCSLEKSWFPYEWFDSPDKLDFPGLRDYPSWYSHLKGGFLLTLAEWEECKRLFQEKGMRTFADWLRYYHDLDVTPGLEALDKMRGFYSEKGIDILKDAVSIPGVSLQYLMMEWVKKRKWFKYAEVDIEIPRRLWRKFEEMPPFFVNQEVPEESVPQHNFSFSLFSQISLAHCKGQGGSGLPTTRSC